MAQKRPTEEDLVEAIGRLLEDLTGEGVVLRVEMSDGQGEVNGIDSAGEAGLASDALELAGINRKSPIQLEDFTARLLPEVDFRGKQNRRISYAILTSAAKRAGLEPDLLDGVIWWADDYWRYALHAAVALIRANAEHQGISVEDLTRQLAERHHVQLG